MLSVYSVLVVGSLSGLFGSSRKVQVVDDERCGSSSSVEAGERAPLHSM